MTVLLRSLIFTCPIIPLLMFLSLLVTIWACDCAFIWGLWQLLSNRYYDIRWALLGTTSSLVFLGGDCLWFYRRTVDSILSVQWDNNLTHHDQGSQLQQKRRWNMLPHHEMMSKCEHENIFGMIVFFAKVFHQVYFPISVSICTISWRTEQTKLLPVTRTGISRTHTNTHINPITGQANQYIFGNPVRINCQISRVSDLCCGTLVDQTLVPTLEEAAQARQTHCHPRVELCPILMVSWPRRFNPRLKKPLLQMAADHLCITTELNCPDQLTYLDPWRGLQEPRAPANPPRIGSEHRKVLE